MVGNDGYELLRDQDQARVAPGDDEVLKLFEAGPNLILLDEVVNYLISAGGVKVEKTTLRDETLTFLQRLIATRCSRPGMPSPTSPIWPGR